MRLDLPYPLLGIPSLQRGNPKGDVLVNLREDAPQTEHHGGAKGGIIEPAHDYFKPFRGLLAHEHAINVGLGESRPHGIQDQLVSSTSLFVIAYANDPP